MAKLTAWNKPKDALEGAEARFPSMCLSLPTKLLKIEDRMFK